MNIENNEADDVVIELDEVIKTDDDVIVIKEEDKPSDPPPADPVDSSLEELKAQLERERTARAEAERRANEASRTAFQAQTEVHDSNLHLVTNAIETISQSNAMLKANYREAMAAQDFDAAAEIQAEMSSNAAKLLQLEQGKQALENAPRAEAPQPYVSDPVEALASQLSPRSADWVRRNPQFATDPRLYSKMLAAHNLAVADGIKPDTDDYFESIEGTLRLSRRRDAGDDASAAAAKPTQRRSSPPAAPVSRSGSATGGNPNVVRLSAAEREMAQMMGMTPEEYGRNKRALQKEGKLG